MRPDPITVESLQAEALRVARQLPEAHSGARPFRDSHRFMKVVQGFVEKVYSLDPSVLSDIEDFERAEAMVHLAVHAIEIHILARYTQRDGPECQLFASLIRKLRVAAEGLSKGIAPDPARRPSEKEMNDFAGKLLLDILPRS